ncbi:developmentally-regulated G-protein 2-like isoform X2 [Spinacia oleracea]|uniref:Developmentally-regulated G-protein 2-like isoform X2 n=1 Tax=Spinacia oleracea TaxID=3562 RepID=A0ABM3QS50_SPIOL|nr:developmentally-regulated G-protein 2-like isoform X2 [Spinacia oleracea]
MCSSSLSLIVDDVIEGSRKYINVYVYNTIDVVGIDDVDRLARLANSIVISANMKIVGKNVQWAEKGLVRGYTKP